MKRTDKFRNECPARHGLNGSDNELGIFARGAIIGAKIEARFLWFDLRQNQWPAALGTRRSEIVDELEESVMCIDLAG